MHAKRLLAVCQGGTVRSGALAVVAKELGWDALQVSWQVNDAETIYMLSQWADVIVVAEADFSMYVPIHYRSKLWDAALGPDRWGNPLNPELLTLARKVITDIRDERRPDASEG